MFPLADVSAAIHRDDVADFLALWLEDPDTAAAIAREITAAPPYSGLHGKLNTSAKHGRRSGSPTTRYEDGIDIPPRGRARRARAHMTSQIASTDRALLRSLAARVDVLTRVVANLTRHLRAPRTERHERPGTNDRDGRRGRLLILVSQLVRDETFATGEVIARAAVDPELREALEFAHVSRRSGRAFGHVCRRFECAN